MAKPTFNFNMGNGISSAKEVLDKIDTQEFFNYKIVPYEEIEPNIINDYPIIDIEELAEEIKNYGLIEPLGIILNKNFENNTSNKKYRLYSGERRYTAIGLILSENPDYPAFKKGVPCMIEKKELSSIDEEIKLILANKQRNMTEEFKRKKTQRLIELYKKKSAETGEKINITKKVAEDLHIGERQARRYSTIEKLLPELKEAFDQAKFNLENAASIANMDPESQKLIVSLIQNNKQIGKEELEKVKTERDLFKNKIDKLEIEIQNSSQETKKLKDFLKEKEEEIDKTNLDKETLRNQIKKELQKNSPSNDIISKKEAEIKRLESAKSLLESEKKETEHIILNKENSIIELKLQLEKTNNPDISVSLKEKFKEEAAIIAIEKELDKKIQEYSISLNNFKKKYKEDIKNTIFIEKIARIISSVSND